MSRWMDDTVEGYLRRFVELAARLIGARRVVEMGSGYGYSAYWFARAVGPGGEVVCTDGDPDNAALAEAAEGRGPRST